MIYCNQPAFPFCLSLISTPHTGNSNTVVHSLLYIFSLYLITSSNSFLLFNKPLPTAISGQSGCICNLVELSVLVKHNVCTWDYASFVSSWQQIFLRVLQLQHTFNTSAIVPIVQSCQFSIMHIPLRTKYLLLFC